MSTKGKLGSKGKSCTPANVSPPRATLVTWSRVSASTRVQGSGSFTTADGGFFSMKMTRISSALLVANGMMVELNSNSTRVIMEAKVRKGEAIQGRLTPQLRKAVISLLRDRSPSVSNVDIRTASGMI